MLLYKVRSSKLYKNCGHGTQAFEEKSTSVMVTEVQYTFDSVVSLTLIVALDDTLMS